MARRKQMKLHVVLQIDGIDSEMEARLARAQPVSLLIVSPGKVVAVAAPTSVWALGICSLIACIDLEVNHLRDRQRPMMQPNLNTQGEAKRDGMIRLDNSLSKRPTINNCISSVRGNAEKRCCPEWLYFTLGKSKCNLRWHFFLFHYKIRSSVWNQK